MPGRWKEIKNHWSHLRDQSMFDLNIPCIVITKDGDLFENTLYELVRYIDLPESIPQVQILTYLELAHEIGPELAKQQLISDSQFNAKDFFVQLNNIEKAALNVSMGSINDLLEAIKIANTGFLANPRKMLVIQLGEYRADFLLVSPPSMDG